MFRDGETRILRKIYLADQDGRMPETVWTSDEAGTTREANAEIKQLFGAAVFDTPKPTRLIRRLLELIDDPEALVLDFFAGSSSTAHAVLAQNASDGGSRRFVLVQVAEPCRKGSDAEKAGYTTIADLGRDRIRKAAAQIQPTHAVGEWDAGFRALKVDSANLNDVLRVPDEVAQTELATLTASIKPGRTAEDLLVHVLLDYGIELTLPVATESFHGEQAFVVDDGALIACFAETVNTEIVSAIAERQPLRTVFRDSAFASDADRINAEQLFAEKSPGTDVKAI